MVKSKDQKGGQTEPILEFPQGRADFLEAFCMDVGLLQDEVSIPCTLESLLAGVTKENLHEALETGQAVGNEAW